MKTILLALIALCLAGCYDTELTKGLYKGEKQNFEIVSNHIVKINGKPYRYNFCGSRLWLPNSTYFFEMNEKRLILAAESITTECVLPDMSGDYQWQEPSCYVEVKMNNGEVKMNNYTLPYETSEICKQIKELKTEGDCQLNQLEKLIDVNKTLNEKIKEKTKKLKDMGVKSTKDIPNVPDSKPIAQEIVALSKERDKIMKNQDAILAKVKSIKLSLQQFTQDDPTPEKASPIESIETDEILNNQLQGK